MELELLPKVKRSKGEVCREPLARPDIDRTQAARMATLARALADPIRIQLLDVLRGHAGQVCVCELVPLFEVSQPTVSHHLKVLRDAGLVGSEKRGLWVFYFVVPGVMDELTGWLAPAPEVSGSSRSGVRPA